VQADQDPVTTNPLLGTMKGTLKTQILQKLFPVLRRFAGKEKGEKKQKKTVKTLHSNPRNSS
jgi:hypothetical protein